LCALRVLARPAASTMRGGGASPGGGSSAARALRARAGGTAVLVAARRHLLQFLVIHTFAPVTAPPIRIIRHYIARACVCGVFAVLLRAHVKCLLFGAERVLSVLGLILILAFQKAKNFPWPGPNRASPVPARESPWSDHLQPKGAEDPLLGGALFLHSWGLPRNKPFSICAPLVVGAGQGKIPLKIANKG
jgi:hypothetical protein